MSANFLARFSSSLSLVFSKSSSISFSSIKNIIKRNEKKI